MGAVFLVLAACGSKNSKVEEGNVELVGQQKETIGENEEIQVISRDVLEKRNLKLEDNDLFIGINKTELGSDYHWGGAVVAVDAPYNPNLNHFKLSALPNFKVKLKKEADKLSLKVGGDTLIQLDIVGDQNSNLVLDLEVLGKSLNMYQLLNRGENTYVPLSNQTLRVNYIAPTVTFDVKSVLQNPENTDDKITILTRWYLKKDMGVSAGFKSRQMNKAVGFFGSKGSSEGTVRVFDLYDNQQGVANIPVVVKNFPDVMKQSAANALEEWNNVFEKHLGLRPITYTFVDRGSKLESLIMAGDVRFNVIEWDVYNMASYEGLGPCLGVRESGKTLSCATLIQGPRITERTAKSYNDSSLIQTVLGSTSAMQVASFEKGEKLNLSIGKLAFDIPAMDPHLKDETMEMGSRFMIPPKNMDALTYLQSYIQSVVAHEFGHNLGLRHNFKASIYANENRKTASVMDYLFTFTEHDIHVEEYDDMAIAYGYAGVQPTKTDMYCTDQDVYSKRNIKASVECRRFDFTSNPYKFYHTMVDGLLEDSILSEGADLSRTGGLLNFALEGIVGHAISTYFGISTKAFEASAETKTQDIANVIGDLKAVYCSYKKTLSIAEKTDSKNANVFENVFKNNTIKFAGPLFPEGSFKCDGFELADVSSF